MPNEDKRILVTGGAGFIGANLCSRLLRDGHSVICIDNFVTGCQENIKNIMDNPNFSLVIHDITKPLYFEVDEIYNLACPASPRLYQRNPLFTLRSSLLGAINVLELGQRINAKVLQASTSEVYGDPFVHPQPETYWGNVNPIGPRSCYDEGKRCAETLFLEYHNQYGIDVKLIRIFNTYGPFMSATDGRVICNFIVQALKNESLTIYGDGSQSRSFCYINDLIDGMLRMMDTEKIFPGPVNLGNPVEYTVREVADTILRLTNSNSGLRFLPLPVDDPQRRCPDIALAKNKLNWAPKTPLEKGLTNTITYFRQKI